MPMIPYYSVPWILYSVISKCYALNVHPLFLKNVPLSNMSTII